LFTIILEILARTIRQKKEICHLILDKGAKMYVGEKIAFVTNGARKTGYSSIEYCR
jgi:hypothetical protein